MSQSKNYFCGNCNKLLLKGDLETAKIEIKCTKCGIISVSKEPTKVQHILKELKDFVTRSK